jgi:lipoic acid synthetase
LKIGSGVKIFIELIQIFTKQPSCGHMPVRYYVTPDTFKMYEEESYKMGFMSIASGPMVRSSYHADHQAHAAGVF